MIFNKKDIKTRRKNWVFIFFFERRELCALLNGELSVYLDLKPNA